MVKPKPAFQYDLLSSLEHKSVVVWQHARHAVLASVLVLNLLRGLHRKTDIAHNWIYGDHSGALQEGPFAMAAIGWRMSVTPQKSGKCFLPR